MSQIFLKVLTLLQAHQINSTTVRIRVLEILLSAPNVKFTPSQIQTTLEKNAHPVSLSLVNETLLFFKSRKIIIQLENTSTITQVQSKKGRPESRYMYVDDATKKNKTFVL